MQTRSLWYPFDAPSRRHIAQVLASDPLLGQLEALDRRITIYFRWTTALQLLTLIVIVVLANR